MAFFTGNLFNLIIAFAVIAQVVIYRKQWRIMRRQTAISQAMIDNAKDSFYLSERAYMGLQTFKIKSFLPDQKPELEMVFINGGRTPAWDVAIQLSLNIGNEPNLRDWIDGLGESESFVPAGGTANASGIQPDPIPAKSVTAVENKVVRLFVVGECRYKDIQKRDRIYPFCLVYKPDQRIFKHYKTKQEHR